jgi:hypothetical protein
MIDLAIKSLHPTAKFTIDGEKYNGINWNSLDIEKPSEAEIDAEVKRLQAEYDANQYQRDRQYPSIGDQLDMQYHDQLNGTTTWKDAIAKVKADNPKTKGK